MICRECGYYDNVVTNSRHTPCDSIRRRRQCLKCGYRWTTHEESICRADENVNEMVAKFLGVKVDRLEIAKRVVVATMHEIEGTG